MSAIQNSNLINEQVRDLLWKVQNGMITDKNIASVTFQTMQHFIFTNLHGEYSLIHFHSAQ